MKGQKIADFSQVVGNVTYKPAGSLSRLPAKGNDSIFEMDMIYTGNKSKASLIFADGSILDIAPNSQLKIAPKKDFNNEISISLLQGNVKASIAKTPKSAATKGRAAPPLPNLKFALKADNKKFILTKEKKTLDISFDQKTKVATVKEGEKKKTVVDVRQFTLKAKPLPPPQKPIEIPKPKPKPKPRVVAALAPKPVAKAPVNKNLFPSISPMSGTFWTRSSIAKGIASGLPLRYSAGSVVPPKNWQAQFEFRSGQQKSLITDSDRKPKLFKFSPEISKPKGLIELRLGYKLQSQDPKKQDSTYLDKKRFLFQLKSLERKNTVSLFINNHNFSNKTVGTWFPANPKSKLNSQITLFDGKDLKRLAPLLLEQNFKIVDQAGNYKKAVYIVRDGKFIGALKGERPNKAQAKKYLEALGANLMFFGQKSDLLGTTSSADQLIKMSKKDNLYYVHRGRSIKLDMNLLRAHDSARNFISQVKPTLVKEGMEVLAERK